jgi:hypothetical protein
LPIHYLEPTILGHWNVSFPSESGVNNNKKVLSIPSGI